MINPGQIAKEVSVMMKNWRYWSLEIIRLANNLSGKKLKERKSGIRLMIDRGGHPETMRTRSKTTSIWSMDMAGCLL